MEYEDLKLRLRKTIESKAFLSTDDLPRGIGKTTALIEVAKEMNFYVLLPNSEYARELREKFDYQKIFGIRDIAQIPHHAKIVIDEMPLELASHIAKIKGQTIEIIGGWIL